MKKNKFEIKLRVRFLERMIRKLIKYAISKGWAGELIIDGRFIGNYLKGGNTKPSAARKSLAEAAKVQHKVIKNHFKTNSYPLDIKYLREEILCEYFGFDYSAYIYSILIGKLNLDLVYRLDGAFIVKRKK